VPPPPRRRAATLGILVGLLLAALDSTLVATALPQILEELDGFTLYFLPNAVFMLAQTVSIPVWGRLSDHYGRARFHLLAVVVLVIGSALCGLSHTMSALVASRAVQALGAGGVMSLSFTMIADLYDLEARARMQGAISSVWGIAALAGPLLGGWITRVWEWQGIFWINIPIGIVSAVIVQATWEKRPGTGKGRPDWGGAAFLAFASAALLAGFGLAGRIGWLRPETLGCFAAGIALAAVLVLVERRQADPFIAYDLYRNRLFTTGALTGVCAMISLFAAVMHVPLLVAGVLQRSLETGGLMLTCMMVPWMACSALTRVLLVRYSYRALSLVGMALSGGAYAVLGHEGASGSLAPIVGAMAALGAGLGITVAPLLIAAQNAVPKDRLGAATSLTQFTRSMGAAVGLAIMGTLFVAAFGGKEPDGIIQFRAKHDPEALRALLPLLAAGLRHVFHGAAIAAGLGVLFALMIPPGRAKELKAA
jgi:EmrB/QacA subfamily drug resistance transporter